MTIISTIICTLENISDSFSIATPLVLLLWFLYTQYHSFAKQYYEQMDGEYAGFTPSINPEHPERIYSGIIMKIRDTDNKGFFKGEFDFGETQVSLQNSRPAFHQLSNGVFSILGKVNYKFYRNRKRNPYTPDENRKYSGSLYIVDRFDFDYETQKFETFLVAEYTMAHLREMQAVKFTLKQRFKEDGPELPKIFTLRKRMGITFEPYNNVRDVVFRGNLTGEQ